MTQLDTEKRKLQGLKAKMPVGVEPTCLPAVGMCMLLHFRPQDWAWRCFAEGKWETGSHSLACDWWTWKTGARSGQGHQRVAAGRRGGVLMEHRLVTQKEVSIEITGQARTFTGKRFLKQEAELWEAAWLSLGTGLLTPSGWGGFRQTRFSWLPLWSPRPVWPPASGRVSSQSLTEPALPTVQPCTRLFTWEMGDVPQSS